MPSPREVIAEIMDRLVDRPGHNMLTSEIVKKLDAAGYVIVPKKPTEEMLGAVRVRLGEDAEYKPVYLERGESEEVWQAMIGASGGYPEARAPMSRGGDFMEPGQISSFLASKD